MASVRTLLAVGLAALLCGCGDTANLAVTQGVGPAPTLPEPTRTLLPTIQIAEAAGWPAGRTPTPAAGLQVNAFAVGLDHPRWIYVLPNGDVLVAETNKPPPPPDIGSGGGFRRGSWGPPPPAATITGPRAWSRAATAAASMSVSAQTRTSARMGWTRRRIA